MPTLALLHAGVLFSVSVFHTARESAVWCVPALPSASAGAAGSFSNKPLSPKHAIHFFCDGHIPQTRSHTTRSARTRTRLARKVVGSPTPAGPARYSIAPEGPGRPTMAHAGPFSARRGRPPPTIRAPPRTGQDGAAARALDLASAACTASFAASLAGMPSRSTLSSAGSAPLFSAAARVAHPASVTSVL